MTEFTETLITEAHFTREIGSCIKLIRELQEQVEALTEFVEELRVETKELAAKQETLGLLIDNVLDDEKYE